MEFDRYRKSEHWRSLEWEAQALLPYVLDMMQSGRIEVGTLFAPLDALCVALPAWPRAVVEKGYGGLLHRKLVRFRDGFIEAATAPPLLPQKPGPKVLREGAPDPFDDPDAYVPPKVTIPLQHREPYSARFLRVWKNYPRKVSKGYAWVCWLKAAGARDMDEATLYEAVKVALGWQLRTPGYFPYDEPSKIPHLSTWLNHRRWEDEEER